MIRAFYPCTVGSGINGGVGIILSWVENLGFSRPKRKICITDGKIKVEKLISGGDGYSGPKSKYVTESPAIQPVNGQPSLFYCIPCQKNLIKLNRYSCGERTSIYNAYKRTFVPKRALINSIH